MYGPLRAASARRSRGATAIALLVSTILRPRQIADKRARLLLGEPFVRSLPEEPA